VGVVKVDWVLLLYLAVTLFLGAFSDLPGLLAWVFGSPLLYVGAVIDESRLRRPTPTRDTYADDPGADL
jgi:hypothetical protein